jgi:hypothetical protein
LGVILGFTVSTNWIFLSAFVGLGLTFAGLTDICLMGELLGKMPWNGRSQCKVELHSVEPAPAKRERKHSRVAPTVTESGNGLE